MQLLLPLRLVLACALVLNVTTNFVAAQTLRTFSEQTNTVEKQNSLSKPDYSQTPDTQTLLLNAATQNTTRQTQSHPKNLGLDPSVTDSTTVFEPAPTPTRTTATQPITTTAPTAEPKTSASRAFEKQTQPKASVATNTKSDIPSVGDFFGSLFGSSKDATPASAETSSPGEYTVVLWSVVVLVGILTGTYFLARAKVGREQKLVEIPKQVDGQSGELK